MICVIVLSSPTYTLVCMLPPNQDPARFLLSPAAALVHMDSAVISAAIAGVVSFLTWYSGQRKANAEVIKIRQDSVLSVDKLNLEAVTAEVNFGRALRDELRGELNRQREDFERREAAMRAEIASRLETIRVLEDRLSRYEPQRPDPD